MKGIGKRIHDLLRQTDHFEQITAQTNLGLECLPSPIDAAYLSCQQIHVMITWGLIGNQPRATSRYPAATPQ